MHLAMLDALKHLTESSTSADRWAMPTSWTAPCPVHHPEQAPSLETSVLGQGGHQGMLSQNPPPHPRDPQQPTLVSRPGQRPGTPGREGEGFVFGIPAPCLPTGWRGPALLLKSRCFCRKLNHLLDFKDPGGLCDLGRTLSRARRSGAQWGAVLRLGGVPWGWGAQLAVDPPFTAARWPLSPCTREPRGS